MPCPFPPKIWKQVQLHDTCKARKPYRSFRVCHGDTDGEADGGEGDRGEAAPAGNLRVSQSTSLSLNNKTTNWGGSEESQYPPLKVCAGVKRMVLHHFLHCLACLNPSVDGRWWYWHWYLLDNSIRTAKTCAVQSTQEHVHPKPSLGLIREVGRSIWDGACG